MKYTIELSQFSTEYKSTWGGSQVNVTCNAKIDNGECAENYVIHYYRDPITGSLRSVSSDIREHTTEHTLTPDKVVELVEDELNNQ